MNEIADLGGAEALEEICWRFDGLSCVPGRRAGGGAPKLRDLALEVGTDVPPTPVGPARTLPFEAEPQACRPALGVPEPHCSWAWACEVRSKRVRALGPLAAGFVAGVQDSVVCKPCPHLGPVGCLDRCAKKLLEAARHGQAGLVAGVMTLERQSIAAGTCSGSMWWAASDSL